MIEVGLPTGSPASDLTRGFAACLASVTELPVTELPLPPTDLGDALGAWRAWLPEHGLGLVPIGNPERFQWAGWWIAIVRHQAPETDSVDTAVLAFGTPPGIVLSPQDGTLVGRAIANLPVTSGYVVASLDPVPQPVPATHDLSGAVEALAIAPAAEADMRLLDAAQALAGRGLDGDRYATSAGTFSSRNNRRPGYDLTLITAEALDELASSGDPIDFAATRRNILTRGVDLNVLVGRTFRIGDVLCHGRRLCEPCAHLEQLNGPGLLRPLIHKGGLRADILTDGQVRIGATIRVS